ncbi:MAG TPA: hypothetical protein VGJ20_20470 [Xanthobacteraceae bacterium]|jgi:hypothetical protein
MADEGRSLGDVYKQAFRNTYHTGPANRQTSTDISSYADPLRVNRYAREVARVGTGYRSSPNRNLLRGAARRGYRG